MSTILTEKGLALLKNNGKVIKDAIAANEKALDEHKWYLSSKTAEGKPRKRSTYVQYLRGKMEALTEIAEGKMLTAWVPKEKAVVPALNVNLSATDIQTIVAKAVAEALAKAK